MKTACYQRVGSAKSLFRTDVLLSVLGKAKEPSSKKETSSSTSKQCQEMSVTPEAMPEKKVVLMSDFGGLFGQNWPYCLEAVSKCPPSLRLSPGDTTACHSPKDKK